MFILFLVGLLSSIPLTAKSTELIRDEGDFAKELIQIKNQYQPKKAGLFYFRINVLQAKMEVFHVDEIGGLAELELVSTHKVGTPKTKEYPLGIGIITQIEKNPSWHPTPETIDKFEKKGLDLEQFRDSNGKVTIPPNHEMNYMGPVKMFIHFITPQKTARLRRDVYRIHGTLENDRKKLGTRCSGGCIRVANEEIKELRELTRRSTIIIEYI